jgi:hypothetical protein
VVVDAVGKARGHQARLLEGWAARREGPDAFPTASTCL